MHSRPGDPVTVVEEIEAVRSAGHEVVEQVASRRGPLDRGDVIRIAAAVAGSIAVLGIGVAILVALFAGSSAADGVAEVRADQRIAEARAEDDRTQIQASLRAGIEANRRMIEQGLAPVPIDPSTPVSAATDAATAQVLAGLGAPERGQPSRIATAIADTVRATPNVAPMDVAGAVAGYLAANPEAVRGPQGEPGDRGPQGEQGGQGGQGPQGEPGRTPTAGEIEAAFREAVRGDPQLVCAGQGGTFTLVRGIALQGGGTLDAWVCSGGISGPPPEPEPEPEPEPSTEPLPTTPAQPPPTSEPSDETASQPATPPADEPLLDLGG